MARPFFLTLALSGATLACAFGCGGEEEGPAQAGGSGQGGAASELPYEPCPPGEAVGEFKIALASDYTSVGGSVLDGVSPAKAKVEVARVGACRLVKSENPLCDQACPGSAPLCAENNQCVAEPRTHDLGTVTVRGLVIPLEMSPKATKTYSNPPGLPHPGYEPGADLRIITSGGDYAPFELRGWGVSLLEVGPEPVRVAHGQPSVISWLAPETEGPAWVHASLNINFHGSNGAQIDCDFPDTGAAEIPAALIDGLIAEGTTTDPTLTLTRRSATSLAIEPGCVEMLVLSELALAIDVEGVISCRDSSDCSEGQTCIPVELFCE